jgi:uncharacterized protein involved in exopolysaccharide biosynthesis
VQSPDTTSQLLPYPREIPGALVRHPGATAVPTLGDELRQGIAIFLVGWKTILLTTLAAVILVIAYIWTTQPLYRAQADILIDPRQRQIMSGAVTPTGLGSSALGADTLLLDSQVEVIESQSVLDRVLREEDLIDDPEFGGTAGPSGAGPLGMLKNLAKSVVYGPNGSPPPLSPYDSAMKALRKRLTVGRANNTYVISIAMLSADPDKAARIANRIAEVYVDVTSEAVAQSTGEAAATLDARLSQLRAAAEAADQAVETYKAENGLIGAQDLLVVEQQLRDLNTDLSKARLDTDAAKADLQQAKQATGPNGIDTDRIESNESPVMAQLLVLLAQLDAEQAQLGRTLLPSHPAYAQVLDRKAALLASIKAEHSRIIDRLQTRYDAALGTQNGLETRLHGLEQKTADANLATVHLNELQRTADANRTVYEEVLKRSKEATEQVGLPTSTARVISSARPASRPSFPQVPVFLMAAAALGLMAGLALAWIRHILRGPPPSQYETIN